ncbi:MAG: peptidyl-prolyl cis-trans isomerase [Gemmatimonadales bacterium]
MQAFRNAAKPIVIVLTASFFLWLVFDLSGLGGGGGGLISRSDVGKVNGQAINLRLFDQRVQNAINNEQERASGPLGLDQITAIRQQVWDQVVREVLFNEEYSRRRLTVTDDEVAEAIRNIPLPEIQQLPELQTNGRFDPEKYQRWLASAVGQSLVPSLEYQYRDQLMQAKLYRSVVSNVFISDAALWERYRDEREQVKVGLAVIDPTSDVSDAAAPVTPEEARAYYDQHRDEFKRERQAYLSYLYVRRVPDASDTAAARNRLLSIKAEIEGGAPFAEVAQRESADSGSGAMGGDLGESSPDQYVPAFEEAVKTLPLNTLSDPVLTQFGFHLVKVESRSRDKVHAHHILVPIEITGDHRDQLDTQADSLEALAAERLDAAAMDTASRALNIPIRAVGPFVKGQRVTTPEGGEVPDAGVWAFLAEPGEQSQVIEAPNAYYVFRLDSMTREGVPPFDRVSTEAEQRARLAKKAEKAAELARQLVSQAETSGLATAAASLGFQYREVGPFARLTASLPSPVLIGAAFGLAEGKVSQPIRGDDTPDGVDRNLYVLQAIERIPADSTDFAANLAAIRNQALNAARQSRFQSYMTALRESARITDNRDEIYRTAAQNAERNAGLGLP